MSRQGRVWQEGRASGEAALRGVPWYFVVDVSPPGAVRKQVKERGFPTKEAAEERLAELLGQVRSGMRVEPSKETFGGYLTQWMAGLETSGRRPSTIEGYRQTIRRNVLRHDVAQVRLQQLTATGLDELYAQLLTVGGRDGRGLSMRTVRLLHTILQRALADAERRDLIKRNPARLASPPSSTAAKAPEFSAWTPNELRTFLESAHGRLPFPWGQGQKPKCSVSHHATLFRTGAMTGLRRGELCGLRWDDLDLDAGRLTVRHTLLVVKGQIVEGTPKTARGRRTLDVDETTVAALRAHRKAQLEVRLLVGSAYEDQGFVFAQPDGAPWYPDGVSQVFDRLVSRLDVRRIRFHDLRHTHASHLLAAGVNAKVVSERLGHSSVSFTLDTYAHVMPGQQAEAAAAAAALVDR